MLCLFHRHSHVEVEGVHKVLRAIEHGTQKRFLHYYAPRTGKTLVQASLAYWLMRLSTLDLTFQAAKLQQKSAYHLSNSLLVLIDSLQLSLMLFKSCCFLFQASYFRDIFGVASKADIDLIRHPGIFCTHETPGIDLSLEPHGAIGVEGF